MFPSTLAVFWAMAHCVVMKCSVRSLCYVDVYMTLVKKDPTTRHAIAHAVEPDLA